MLIFIMIWHIIIHNDTGCRYTKAVTQFICKLNREHIPPSNCRILEKTFITPQSYAEQLRKELFREVRIWLKLSEIMSNPPPNLIYYQCNPLPK